jgi:hypothetical protein
MMEAVSTSETSVYLYETTRRNIPEDSQNRKEVGMNTSKQTRHVQTLVRHFSRQYSSYEIWTKLDLYRYGSRYFFLGHLQVWNPNYGCGKLQAVPCLL